MIRSFAGLFLCFEDGALFEILSPTEEDLAAAMQRMICAEIPLAIHRDWAMTLKKLEEKKLPMPDASIANRASIVIKLTYRKIKMLFCGDAPAAAILKGLQNTQESAFDLVKLPHHGSSRNISEELLQMIEARNYLLCADGTAHPNKQTIAKLLKYQESVTIYSNYAWWENGFFCLEDYEILENKKLKVQEVS